MPNDRVYVFMNSQMAKDFNPTLQRSFRELKMTLSFTLATYLPYSEAHFSPRHRAENLAHAWIKYA